MSGHKLLVGVVSAFVLIASIMVSSGECKEKVKQTELVQYATGPGAEVSPDVLQVREVEVVQPDSDRLAALKTTGKFILDVVTLPVKIVQDLWESATD